MQHALSQTVQATDKENLRGPVWNRLSIHIAYLKRIKYPPFSLLFPALQVWSSLFTTLRLTVSGCERRSGTRRARNDTEQSPISFTGILLSFFWENTHTKVLIILKYKVILAYKFNILANVLYIRPERKFLTKQTF